ncbi:hypothetical protein NPA08_03845 [Mycoplasmopsis citelli]|uniref:hypothetical protein n=1 Tax=Mycoplasmopsis citelli TaxID=171281 RepID=UPI00211594B1|nr:hypothetical protein [Mycoplasmopsis citelli]UUD36059.1 hypothetical protein NPA08_03845 [Mycoplasmopsis citelli]
MNDSVFIISLVLILTYGSYAILFLFKYSDILGKWKFLLFLVNLFLEKNKFNKKIWTLDKKLVQGVLDLYRKTQYYKRYIILDWFFHLTLIISVLVAWLISHIAYEYSFYGQDLVAPLIIFTLPLWWFIFLSVILNKFSKFKKVILKSNAFDLNNIEPLRREKLNHFKKAGKSFLMRNRGIFFIKN